MEINGKQFLNLQEAVAWLLQNNALPFQSTANYAPNTEIAKTTIINPSPAEIKVGALVLFADSKVGTVSGITTNGFMVGSDYTNIQAALAYVSSIDIDLSGNLITTLSDGTTINAGQIKMISSFSIDASQHLIATYNYGTTQDLGPIFSGNVNISGNLTADSIIENMSGYEFERGNSSNYDYEYIYAGMVKTGNKLTLVVALNLTRRTGGLTYSVDLGNFTVPSAVASKLYPTLIGGYNFLDVKDFDVFSTHELSVSVKGNIQKSSNKLVLNLGVSSNMVIDTKYYVRYEATFLLSDNMAN